MAVNSNANNKKNQKNRTGDSDDELNEQEEKPVFSTIQWVEVLVTLIILGGLFWLGSQVVDIGKEISSIRTKVDGTEQRITRISDSLPDDLKIKVAKNDLDKNFEFLIISGHGKLGHIANVDFVDIAEKKISAVTLKDSLQDAKAIEYWLAGFAEKNCVNPISLLKIVELWDLDDDTEEITFKATVVDLSNSYACQELKSDLEVKWLTDEEPVEVVLKIQEIGNPKLKESLKAYDKYKKILEPKKTRKY